MRGETCYTVRLAGQAPQVDNVGAQRHPRENPNGRGQPSQKGERPRPIRAASRSTFQIVTGSFHLRHFTRSALYELQHYENCESQPLQVVWPVSCSRQFTWT